MRVLCVVLALILSGCVSASGASHDSPEPVPSFAPVPVPGPSVAAVVRQPGRFVEDLIPRVREMRPTVAVPSPRLIVVDRSDGLGVAQRKPLAGTASWYCGQGSPCTRGYGPDCYCAAAGPGLRVGDWRGRQVVVMASGRRVRVTLVDWCQCGGGARLIDLFSTPFSRLAPLSRGVVKVTVSW